jgi:hypothetical protein
VQLSESRRTERIARQVEVVPCLLCDRHSGGLGNRLQLGSLLLIAEPVGSALTTMRALPDLVWALILVVSVGL